MILIGWDVVHTWKTFIGSKVKLILIEPHTFCLDLFSCAVFLNPTMYVLLFSIEPSKAPTFALSSNFPLNCLHKTVDFAVKHFDEAHIWLFTVRHLLWSLLGC